MKNNIIVKYKSGNISLRLSNTQVSKFDFEIIPRNNFYAHIEGIEDHYNYWFTNRFKRWGTVDEVKTFQLQYKNLSRLKIFNCITCALTSKEKIVPCFCGSTTKKAWLPQQKYSCIMEFDKDSDFVWATLFCNMLREVFPVDNPTKDKIQTFLLEMKNFQMMLDREGTTMNTTDLTLKYFS